MSITRDNNKNERARADADVGSNSISLIIPTYNERENIVGMIQRCSKSLETYNSEIIVVDDDSPDKTWEVARESFGEDESIRVIRRHEETDLATAISRGFSESTSDVCAVIDADFQHPPEKIPELVEAVRNGTDIAVASRYLREGDIENWSQFRKLVSKGAVRVSQIGIPAARRLSDPISGFFALRKDLLEDIVLEQCGYKILLEVLVKCDWDELSEIPYVFTEREEGKSNLTGTEYVLFLEHVIHLGIIDRGWDDIIEPHRAVRIAEFGIVGAIGAGINTLVFLTSYTVLQIQYLVAGVMAFLFAVNWNFTGNWFLTFDKPDGRVLHQYVRFHGVCLGGFVVYLSTLALAIDVLALPALVANVTAIGAGATVNFLGAENVAFIERTPIISGLRSDQDGGTIERVKELHGSQNDEREP